uniref:40S ribosomal protein S21 n=1 Tax=Ursus americanus TaxID=9643 RepID=A0A452R518_URSAM
LQNLTHTLPFCACTQGSGGRRILDSGEFGDLYVPWKCSVSNHIICAKDHSSIQLNVAEVDKVTGSFNGPLKTYVICGAIHRLGDSHYYQESWEIYYKLPQYSLLASTVSTK